MTSFHYKQLRAEADDSLRGFGKTAGRLILLHAGVSIGISLVLTALNYVLDLGIAETGGLSGIGTRTTLETIQTLLTYVQTIALPFWEIGYIFAILQMARRQSAEPQNLLQGFRNFGPVIRSTLLRAMVYFAVMMVGAQIASFIFMLTPAAKDLYALTEELMTSAETLDYAALLESEEYMAAMMPAVPFMLVGMLLPLIPIAYRLRMMDFVIMDEPKRGAFYAFGASMRMTRKRCWALFKLDLRFWWYYLLEVLTVALGYGDVILPLLGVELNMNADLAMYLFYALALIAELGLYVWKKNQVFATYALLYDDLRIPEIPQPAPQNVPWNY